MNALATIPMIGPAQKAELVAAIYEKCGLPAAAEHCHLKLRDVLDAVDEDDDFSAEVERAMEHLTTLGEQEMIRRAIKGTESAVVSQGRVVMVQNDEGISVVLKERKYSDSLLVKFLESRKREVYGPKVEIAHKHSGYIALPVMDAGQIQELLDKPGDDITFIDAEFEEINGVLPRAVKEAEIEEDYEGEDDPEEDEADFGPVFEVRATGEEELSLDQDWDIL